MIREHEKPDGTVSLEYCCDFCSYCTTNNKSNKGITPIMECDACGRLMCSGHRRFHKEPWVDSHKGMYCLECWELGKGYRDQMVSIQNQAWEKENDLRLQWHKEGRNQKRLKTETARRFGKRAAASRE
jgi:hypothetical protein